MTSDKAGLERKFEAKERNRNKPGVVLWMNRAYLAIESEVETTKHWDEDILLGCILPWREDAYAKYKPSVDAKKNS